MPFVSSVSDEFGGVMNGENMTPKLFSPDLKVLYSDVEYSCEHFNVMRLMETHTKFNGNKSNERTWNLFTRKKSAVAVLIHNLDNDKILLVEQVRPALVYQKGVAVQSSVSILEVVAGTIEEGESPLQTAIRESKEEAGIELEECIECNKYYLSPGVSNETVTNFYAPISSKQIVGFGGGVEAEDEDIRLHWVDWGKALKMIADGEIVDAKTIIAIYGLVINW